jgi:4-hydroxybenzoate polyprenyltransferase
MEVLKGLFWALRPGQWIKNLVVFLPLLFSKKCFIPLCFLDTALAFLVFCLSAGAVYLLNDVFDLKKDAAHSGNCLRPLAAGKITVLQCSLAALCLAVVSVFFAFRLDALFGWIMVAYFLLNVFYTKCLREIFLVDVFCLSGFFLFRIISGTVVIRGDFSAWILIVAGLIGLFLGFNKRLYEIKFLKSKAGLYRSVLEEYSAGFISQVSAVLAATILVLYALFTVDVHTAAKFGTKNLVYSIPFFYYGVFRYLYLVKHVGAYVDPTYATLSDRKMQIDILLWAVVCMAVIYGGK